MKALLFDLLVCAYVLGAVLAVVSLLAPWEPEVKPFVLELLYMPKELQP